MSRACNILRLSRSAYLYKPAEKRDHSVTKALLLASKEHPRWGFEKLFALLKNQGYKWNHKRVYRVYKENNLNLRSKKKKRLKRAALQPLCQSLKPNVEWSMDFMHDALSSGRSIRTFNIIDNYSREALAISIDYSLPARRVVQTLDQLKLVRGLPRRVRVDNGPEFVSNQLSQWAQNNNVELVFIQPGQPHQNGLIERFNRTYREEVLDYYVFKSVDQVRDLTYKWLKAYNSKRPHCSLGNKSPHEFMRLNGYEGYSHFTWY